MSMDLRTRTCEHRCYVCDPPTEDERLEDSRRYIRSLVIRQRWILLHTAVMTTAAVFALALLLR